MSETGNWQASLFEQRTAWGIAACCMVLVLLVSTRPEWFDFSFANQKQATERQLKQSPAQQRTAHVNARVKPHPLAPKKPHVASTQAQPHVAAKKTSEIAKGFYIQLGAFKERPRAQGLADQLKRKGWHTVVFTKQGGLHAVWVGPRKTNSEAERLLKSILLKLKNKGFIVQKN